MYTVWSSSQRVRVAHPTYVPSTSSFPARLPGSPASASDRTPPAAGPRGRRLAMKVMQVARMSARQRTRIQPVGIKTAEVEIQRYRVPKGPSGVTVYRRAVPCSLPATKRALPRHCLRAALPCYWTALSSRCLHPLIVSRLARSNASALLLHVLACRNRQFGRRLARRSTVDSTSILGWELETSGGLDHHVASRQDHLTGPPSMLADSPLPAFVLHWMGHVAI